MRLLLSTGLILLLVLLPMTSVKTASPRISATAKLSCNHDGTMNIDIVPLNHQ